MNCAPGGLDLSEPGLAFDNRRRPGLGRVGCCRFPTAGAFPVAFVALWAFIGWRLSRWAKGR